MYGISPTGVKKSLLTTLVYASTTSESTFHIPLHLALAPVRGTIEGHQADLRKTLRRRAQRSSRFSPHLPTPLARPRPSPLSLSLSLSLSLKLRAAPRIRGKSRSTLRAHTPSTARPLSEAVCRNTPLPQRCSPARPCAPPPPPPRTPVARLCALTSCRHPGRRGSWPRGFHSSRTPGRPGSLPASGSLGPSAE